MIIKVVKSFLILLPLLTACSQEKDKRWPGYIEGEYTYIARNASGNLVKLAVKRGRFIQKGDLLYQLDPEPEQSQVASIQAKIKDLEAQVTLANIQLTRQKQLYTQNATSKTNVDQAQADFTSKTEQLTGARADLSHAQWSLQQKTVYAPISGQVFNTFYRENEQVSPDQPVLAVLDAKHIKVLFYIPEHLLSSTHLGQTINFTCTQCPAKTHGKISYISPEPEYTPPVIYSQDSRDKLVYLIRADLKLEQAFQFHPGQAVDVQLHE